MVKQTLKLRHVFGHPENAVHIQVITALIAFVLVELAFVAQRAIDSMTHFSRLSRANVLHRRPLENMRPAKGRERQLATNTRQQCLLEA